MQATKNDARTSFVGGEELSCRTPALPRPISAAGAHMARCVGLVCCATAVSRPARPLNPWKARFIIFTNTALKPTILHYSLRSLPGRGYCPSNLEPPALIIYSKFPAASVLDRDGRGAWL